MKKNKPILTILFFNILLFAILVSCSIHKNPDDNKNILFAEKNGNRYEIKIDTLNFKKEIGSSIFSPDSKVEFDKIEIVKQYTIGEKAKEFYYLMMTDFDKKVKTCRWLVFDGKNLYLNNYIKKDVSNVEFVYLSCVGNENCNPNIYNLDGKDYWICGDNPICLKEGQTRAGCDIYTTFIGN